MGDEVDEGKEEMFSSLSLLKEKLCHLCHFIYFSFIELQAYIILMCFTNTVFLTNWSFVATLCGTSLPAHPIFQKDFLAFYLCVTFW